MKDDKDGAGKNLEVVKRELKAFGADQWHNLKRLGKALYDVLHICVAFVSTTLQYLPRTLTYAILLVGGLWIIYKLMWGINANSIG